MKHVFISYSRKDLEFIEKLAKDLQRAGYDVWYDLSDLEGGDRWASEIQAGIDQCDVFVTVISPHSMASEWVEKEFLYASSARKNIVPLMYEPAKLPIWLLNIHYIDIKGRNYKKNFPVLLAAIEDQEQPVVPAEPARGWAALSPLWIGGIAGGIVLVLAAMLGIRAFLPGVASTPEGQGTIIPVASFSTFTPASVTETTIPPAAFPSPAFTAGPATEAPATPTLALAITDPREVEMLLVPAGNFYMGSDQGTEHEKPIHVVRLDAFYIDKNEVTNAQYKAYCSDDSTCLPPFNPKFYFDLRYNDHPVIHVNWYQAVAYCEWRGARLPTEAEWEKAARGTSVTTELLDYPWGNRFNGKIVNSCDDKCSFGVKRKGYNDGYENTAPVGSYEAGKSPYGVNDMAGNVKEWVSDWYSESYYAESTGPNPFGPDTGDFRVLRGGSWADNMYSVRTFVRGFLQPGKENNYVGFRCARSAYD